MAKPEWGAKRMCQSCGTRYYDLRQDPPVCPKCGTAYAAKPLVRPRRASQAEEQPKVATPSKKTKTPKESEAIDDDLDNDGAKDLDDEDALESDDDDDDGLMEDASDLGEDDDDVSEVMEHLDDEDLSDRE